MIIIKINVKKTTFIKDGYRRPSCTSKTAKIHRFVRFVKYCVITTVLVAFYWARSGDTVHYKCNKMLNFCCFRCATTLLMTIFYKRCFLHLCLLLIILHYAEITCLRRNGQKTTSSVKYDPRYEISVRNFLYNENFRKLDHNLRYFS